jgi:hypothetical protein
MDSQWTAAHQERKPTLIYARVGVYQPVGNAVGVLGQTFSVEPFHDIAGAMPDGAQTQQSRQAPHSHPESTLHGFKNLRNMLANRELDGCRQERVVDPFP